MVKGLGDRLFDGAVYVVLALVGLVALFPLLYVVAVSLTPFGEVLRNGGYVVIPRAVTFDAYRQFLTRPEIPRAFGVTAWITVVGTLVNLVLTTLMAYPLSKRALPGRNIFLLLVVFTLLFNGGIIPTYLTVKAVGLIDTRWALILPNAIWSFNVLIMKSFFEALPEEIFESARMDGAGEFRILWQIALPLSVPVLLTIGLFYGVSHWNEFYQAILYITNPDLRPLQVVVRALLSQAQNLDNVDMLVPTVTLQMAAVVLASLPAIIVYPFIQKYFTKGVLLGSIKG